MSVDLPVEAFSSDKPGLYVLLVEFVPARHASAVEAHIDSRFRYVMGFESQFSAPGSHCGLAHHRHAAAKRQRLLDSS